MKRPCQDESDGERISKIGSSSEGVSPHISPPVLSERVHKLSLVTSLPKLRICELAFCIVSFVSCKFELACII